MLEIPSSERRRALLSFVHANPGACLSEAARATGIPKTSTLHHVKILKRHGMVKEVRQGRQNVLLPSHHETSIAASLTLQRDARLSELLEWLRSHPRAAQKDALRAMEGLGWSRSTTQHRLRRLTNAGLVATVPKGRMKLYHAKDPEITQTKRVTHPPPRRPSPQQWLEPRWRGEEDFGVLENTP